MDNYNNEFNDQELNDKEHPSNDQKDRLSFTELLYGILFHPQATFKKVARLKPLYYSFIILVGVSLLNNLISFLTTHPLQQLPPDMPQELIRFIEAFSSPGYGVLGALFSTFFTTIFWFILSAILQLSAELLGGKGTAIGVMTVLASSSLPQILAIPFIVLIFLLGLPPYLLMLISLPLFVWSQLVLPVLGIREVQQFSLGRAVLTLLMPLVVIISVIFALMFMIISLLMPLFA